LSTPYLQASVLVRDHVRPPGPALREITVCNQVRQFSGNVLTFEDSRRYNLAFQPLLEKSCNALLLIKHNAQFHYVAYLYTSGHGLARKLNEHFAVIGIWMSKSHCESSFIAVGNYCIAALENDIRDFLLNLKLPADWPCDSRNRRLTSKPVITPFIKALFSWPKSNREPWNFCP